VLARFHKVSRSFEAPVDDRRPLRQYENAGLIAETSTRLGDPRLILMQVEILAQRWGAQLDEALARARRLDRDYGDPVYRALGQLYNHGDYHPANMLFGASGEVVGIFDLDRTFYGSRLFDVAMLLHYVVSRRTDLGGACDIWSLTQGYPPDVGRSTRALERVRAPRAFRRAGRGRPGSCGGGRVRQ